MSVLVTGGRASRSIVTENGAGGAGLTILCAMITSEYNFLPKVYIEFRVCGRVKLDTLDEADDNGEKNYEVDCFHCECDCLVCFYLFDFLLLSNQLHP